MLKIIIFLWKCQIEEQTKIPGVCVKNTTFDVDTLANAYTGCGDNDEECKTSSLDGDPTYGDPPEGQTSFFGEFFKLNIENTILLTENMRKDQGFIENLFSVGGKIEEGSPLWKWKKKHKEKKEAVGLSTENMVFIGIVVAVVVLLSFLLITSGAIGAIGGAISSAWTGLCSGVGWLTGAGAASTGGGSIIGSVAGKALLDTGKEAFVSTTKQ